jgi:hypothetical protein
MKPPIDDAKPEVATVPDSGKAHITESPPAQPTRLLAQIVGLERRTARGGRDSIDHAPGAHDDVANAAAGVVAALTSSNYYYETMDWVSGSRRFFFSENSKTLRLNQDHQPDRALEIGRPPATAPK